MIEKILFDKELIKKVLGRDNVSILFIKYDPELKKAFYKTNNCQTYKFISFDRIANL